MFIIRETFIAKPGHAGEFAKMMRDEVKNMGNFKGYVLLDMVTDYNTIVIEYEIESLAEFEKSMADHKKELAAAKSSTPPPYTQLYQTGKREIFKVVE